MSRRRATSPININEALPNLREHDAIHAFPTLAIMAEHAHDGHDGHDEWDGRIVKPTGFLLAGGEWLAGRVGIGRNTVSRHLHALKAAGEIKVWTPYNRRQGRATEYVVIRLMTRKGRNEVDRRTLFHQHRPQETMTQCSPPSTSTGPLDWVRDSDEKQPESRNPLPTPLVITTGGEPIGIRGSSVGAGIKKTPDRPAVGRFRFTSDYLRIECRGISDGQARGIGKVIDNLAAGGQSSRELIEDVARLWADSPDDSMLHDLAHEWAVRPNEAWGIAKGSSDSQQTTVGVSLAADVRADAFELAELVEVTEVMNPLFGSSSRRVVFDRPTETHEPDDTAYCTHCRLDVTGCILRDPEPECPFGEPLAGAFDPATNTAQYGEVGS